MEDLAKVAKRGQFTVTISFNSEDSLVDEKVEQQLEKPKKKHRGNSAEFTGRVVGSSMRRRYIEIRMDQYRLAHPS
jgi:hypothetical protein